MRVVTVRVYRRLTSCGQPHTHWQSLRLAEKMKGKMMPGGNEGVFELCLSLNEACLAACGMTLFWAFYGCVLNESEAAQGREAETRRRWTVRGNRLLQLPICAATI